MPSNLLLDPLMSMYSTKELLKLKQVNKEYASSINNYIKAHRHFSVLGSSSDPWGTRMRLYSMFPKIEHLTLEVNYQNNLTDYLRPHTQRLDLVIPLHLEEERDTSEYSLINTNCIVTALQDLLTYIQANPSSLKELTISFSPKVNVTFLYLNQYIVGFDRHGPVYDDMELTKSLKVIAPAEFLVFLPCITQRLLRSIFLDIAKHPTWKKITVPYHFPGAQEILGAQYTDIFEKSEELIERLEETLRSLRVAKN